MAGEAQALNSFFVAVSSRPSQWVVGEWVKPMGTDMANYGEQDKIARKFCGCGGAAK
jgi:hypothetical protein